jgi:hypothetical protein
MGWPPAIPSCLLFAHIAHILIRHFASLFARPRKWLYLLGYFLEKPAQVLLKR